MQRGGRQYIVSALYMLVNVVDLGVAYMYNSATALTKMVVTDNLKCKKHVVCCVLLLL